MHRLYFLPIETAYRPHVITQTDKRNPASPFRSLASDKRLLLLSTTAVYFDFSVVSFLSSFLGSVAIAAGTCLPGTRVLYSVHLLWGTAVGGKMVETIETLHGLGSATNTILHEYQDRYCCRDLFIYLVASRTRTCCLLYTSPSPRDKRQSRMPSSA